MNRLILLGNGFDLAHGLKTSYKNFIDWYWLKWRDKLISSSRRKEEDSLCSFELKDTSVACWYLAWSFVFGQDPRSLNSNEFVDLMKNNTKIVNFKRSRFLENISKSIETRGWVDIEEEYYKLLKYIVRNNSTGDFVYWGHPEVLNKELSTLREELIRYLATIEIKTELKIDEIKKIFYSPIQEDDISIAGHNYFEDHLICHLKLESHDLIEMNKRYYEKGVRYQIKKIDEFKQKYNSSENILPEIMRKTDIKEYLSFPDKVLIINFNYTDTDSLYYEDNSNIETIHIHGEIHQSEKIIFGYGDELDDDYKEICKTNTNEYLKNIKSIKYLEDDKYRKVLKFIDESPFQIYILGHSCGMSDRTLLNTLFEHRNCISIKPFYHEDQGNDNYLDIVQNISRDFTDMKLFRDKVVNKLFCKPLPQNNIYREK